MRYMHKRTFDIANGMPYDVTYQKGDGTEIHYDPRPDFFEVDDLLAIPLQILNRKGYLTACSCEGHPFDPAGFHINDDGEWEPFPLEDFSECFTYITFVGTYNFPILPEGFEKDQRAGGTRIFRNHKKDGDYWETLCSVMDSMKALHDWAEALPARKIKK